MYYFIYKLPKIQSVACFKNLNKKKLKFSNMEISSSKNYQKDLVILHQFPRGLRAP